MSVPVEAAGSGPLLLLLRSLVPQLRPAERRVAAFVVDYPEQVQHMSITALAREAGVSTGSVARLCRTAGCSGYPDFRRRLIQDLARFDSPALAKPRQLSDALRTTGAASDVLDAVFQLSVQSLQETLAMIDRAAVARAVEALAQARLVYCFGTGGSGLVAIDAAYRLLRVGVPAQGEGDSQLQRARAALLAPTDVAFAISMSGEQPQTLDTARAAKDAGAVLLVATNHPRSRIGRLADVCLTTVSQQPEWRREAVPARVVQLTLIDALCVSLLRRPAEAWRDGSAAPADKPAL